MQRPQDVAYSSEEEVSGYREPPEHQVTRTSLLNTQAQLWVFRVFTIYSGLMKKMYI